MTLTRRVVITGLGLVSPLGNSPAALWAALSEGRSGVAPLVQLPPLEGRVTFGAECREFTGDIENFGDLEKDLKKSIRKALKMMCRESMMAVAAAQCAIGDAGFGATPMEPDSSGVVFGSDYMLSPPEDFLAAMTTCGAAAGAFEYDQWGGAGLKDMNPLWMLSYLPNMPASHIAIFNNLCGPSNSLTMREASGLMSIREAAQIIERGHAERMVAGATGTRIHSFKTVHALQQEQLANPESEPAAASRPFDAGRTGMVVGEGAGAIVLEEYEGARARGATIYGEVAGTASAAALGEVSTGALNGQCERALASAARAALRAAGMEPGELGHINAHAAGTTAGDAAEASALGAALGAHGASVPVVAVKSSLGNLGAGGGVVETIASLLALHHRELFGTLNYEQADPACPGLVATRDRPQGPGESFLKLSVTPQGQAAAIVVRRG
ncbi:MAG TPA: beta-ketoacyl synthase N-terminal-like domain-containing protein [Lacipirellulaceae bacterium]|nr:beta-ketoacyl synthase N-terminal-like domain-containing protein [Lacipirellulaceae bacterium]